MHEEFEDMLRKLKPRPGVLKIIEHEMMVQFESKVIDVEAINERRAEKQKKVETEIKSYTELLLNTKSPAVIRVYEEKIEELDAERLRLGEKVKPKLKPDFDFGTALKQALEFVSEPYMMWNTDDLAQKRLVLRMVFEEPLVYDITEGFGTAKYTLPVSLSCIKELDELELVEMPGEILNRSIGQIMQWNEAIIKLR
tara:strand:- start:20764 stop:21354 length:591 start_codon:yes stop_codon:yes gene_type:complete